MHRFGLTSNLSFIGTLFSAIVVLYPGDTVEVIYTNSTGASADIVGGGSAINYLTTLAITQLDYIIGPTGYTGSTGLTGATGTILLPSGIWASYNTYILGSVVVSPIDMNTYVCINQPLTNPTTDPSADPTDWSQLISAGPTGPTGNTGPTGPLLNTIQYGTATTDGTTFDFTVTFPTAFASTPNVTATVTGTAAGVITIDSVSSTGFTAYTFDPAASGAAASFPFSWVAVL